MLGGDAFHEPAHVDDEALVGALADTLPLVAPLDSAIQRPSWSVSIWLEGWWRLPSR
jgi:hypothetical protein